MSDPESSESPGSLSSTITKAIAKEAQAESRRLDVLVCGHCHNVFHFIEEFTEHKNDDTCGKPAFRTSVTEDKPQVWAFLLWKSTVALKEKESSWALYNRWCKLDQELRASWTAAGQAILNSSTLSVEAENAVSKLGKEQTVEALSRSTLVVTKMEPEEEEDLVNAHIKETDPLANDEEEVEKSVEKEKEPEVQPEQVVVVKRGRGRPPKVARLLKTAEVIQPKPVLKPDTPITKTVKKEGEEEEGKSPPRVIKMTRAAASMLKSKPGPKRKIGGPDQSGSKVARSKRGDKKPGEGGEDDESEDEDYVVEKILAKRLNPKTKEYEYLLKWEGYPHEQNTWEPVHNMVECEKLVENFERNLAKQKANQAAGHKVITKVVKMPAKKEEPVPGPSTEVRPPRSSKMKAMENVKSWCGSMINPSKRKADGESDSDDVVTEKKIKLDLSKDEEEDGSGDENDDKKTPGLLKSLSLIKSNNVPKRPQTVVTVNGMKGSPTKSPVKIAPAPPPILVANAQGIIKLDSRQVPNLSSGVYIVSNQSGIVKLSNATTASAVNHVIQSPATTVSSGVVRKVVTQATGKSSELTVTNEVKLLPKGSPSGLVRVPTPTTTIIKKRSPLAPLSGPRPLRVLGPRPSSSILQQRPTLKSTGQRPPFIPRPPQILRPPIRSITPGTPRILSKTTFSPAAQVKSGVRPIQAMLGGSLGTSTTVIAAGSTIGMPTGIITKTVSLQRGRKPGPKPGPVAIGLNGKAKESKLVDNDNLHMPNLEAEFQEESSSSDDDGVESLPELPSGDPPSPLGSPLPLTLCPETGKILARAEGEPTPPPSPEPAEILPDVEPTNDDEQCLKGAMAQLVLPSPLSNPVAVPFPLGLPIPMNDYRHLTNRMQPPLAVTHSGMLPVSHPNMAPLLGHVLGSSHKSGPALFEIPAHMDIGEDCLKVEMSPGGTTGTVVNVSGRPFENAMERVHEDGVTVTKMISGEGGSDGEEEEMEQMEREYVTITGEDGVVYQMVTQGNNLMEGQVLMGEDGQQVFMTTSPDQQLSLDTAVADAVSHLIPTADSEESQDTGDDSTQAQVVAQIVEEGEATPGGMRRVVLLLPDGNFMMTEVDEDQYAALDLDSSDTSPAK